MSRALWFYWTGRGLEICHSFGSEHATDHWPLFTCHFLKLMSGIQLLVYATVQGNSLGADCRVICCWSATFSPAFSFHSFFLLLFCVNHSLFIIFLHLTSGTRVMFEFKVNEFARKAEDKQKADMRRKFFKEGREINKWRKSKRINVKLLLCLSTTSSRSMWKWRWSSTSSHPLQ